MTERKPPRMSWESWIDRQIREAQERGDFENLPGAGKPIPGLRAPHDELWWLKQKLRDEKLEVTPPALALRKEVEEAVAKIRAAGTEKAVRRIVAEINERIAAVNATVTSGPPSGIAPLDPEKIVATWRERRDGS
jgi:hypothetical protein